MKAIRIIAGISAFILAFLAIGIMGTIEFGAPMIATALKACACMLASYVCGRISGAAF